tara:strand:+ start:170 stop:667 length:498 start_codon:yes stop_codon:yes gene_type:complete
MNWFKLLKVQTQTQRQGFRLDDKDEDYVLEEDDDCFEKLKKYIGSFFKATPEILDYYGKLPSDVSWNDNMGGATISKGFTKPFPDEYFCRAKKWIEEKLADHNKNVEYKYEDSELSYHFHTVYEPEVISSHKSGGYTLVANIKTKEGIGRYVCVIQKIIKGGESS